MSESARTAVDQADPTGLIRPVLRRADLVHRVDGAADKAATPAGTGLRLGRFLDGGLDRGDPDNVVADMVGFLRAKRPQVVVTFGPDGRTGHPGDVAVRAVAETALEWGVDALAFPDQLAQGLPAWRLSGFP